MKNPLQGANTQMADPNEEPTVPQAAATVLLVRDSKDEGIGIRRTFDNPGGNCYFLLFFWDLPGRILITTGLKLIIANTFHAKCWILKTKEWVLGGQFGIPMEVLLYFAFVLDLLGNILITTNLNFATWQIHSVGQVKNQLFGDFEN